MYFMCFYLLFQGDLVTRAFSLYLGDSKIIRESWHRCACFNSTSSIYILYHHSNHIFLWFICPFQAIVTHTTTWYNTCVIIYVGVNAECCFPVFPSCLVHTNSKACYCNPNNACTQKQSTSKQLLVNSCGNWPVLEIIDYFVCKK